MKRFELSEKVSSNGQRKFKVILHEIYPDSCVDAVNEVGTIFNANGITWIEEYCKKAADSIVGKSIRCEFINEDRTEILGHGATDIIDGVPIFENATMIGFFDKAYVEEIETTDEFGEVVKKKFMIGEGEIDSLCYHNFCERLDHDLMEGNAPKGSVEILRTTDNDAIVYKYGYKDEGRIPMVFDYSGYALLGVLPADQTATILELNESQNFKEETRMDKAEIKAIVEEVTGVNAEMNAYKAECDRAVAEANEAVAAKDAEISELNSKVDALTSELESAKTENADLASKNESLTSEVNSLTEKISAIETAKKVEELNSAIASFTDEQKAYAQAEIDAFKASPLTSEINSVVNKIYEGIGIKSVEEAAKVAAEQNSKTDTVEDIFAAVETVKKEEEDNSIF